MFFAVLSINPKAACSISLELFLPASTFSQTSWNVLKSDFFEAVVRITSERQTHQQ